MHRFFKKTAGKTGLPPGTLVVPNKKQTSPTKLTLMQYDKSHLVEKSIDSFSKYVPDSVETAVTWINVEGIDDPSIIASAEGVFGIHPLVLEDIMHTEQRPKVEDFEDYIFLVLKVFSLEQDTGQLIINQISLVLMPGVVISFQEHGSDAFYSARNRLKADKGRIRKMGADYLAYALLDIVVDSYFGILEQQGDRIENIEQELLDRPSPQTLQNINSLKQEITMLRRSVWPLREVMSKLEKRDSSLIRETTIIYLRDVYDHIIQVVDTVDISRDILSGMLDMYLSTISNSMNQVMKVLTIIATIFIPLTFIAGIYGMNFSYMPELGWRWSYPAALGVMVMVVIVMIAYFRKKKWL